MQEKSKILLLSTAYLPHIGGSELAIKNITDRLSDFEFHLITAKLDKNSPNEEKIGNVLVHRVGGFFSTFKFLLPKNLLPIYIYSKAIELMKSNEFKLVHAYQASGAAGGGWLIKKLYPKIPFIVTIQEGKDLKAQGGFMNYFRNKIINSADSATAISKYLKDYLLSVKNDLPVEIIPNGVDIDKFSKEFSDGELDELRAKFGIRSHDKIIVSTSRLVPKNGMDILIEAMAILIKSKEVEPPYGGSTSLDDLSTRYKLIIAGDGMLEASLKLQVESLRLENNVILAGTVAHDDLPKLLKIGHVFSRPSRSEGLGISFLEAMAAGLPVVATDVGGIKDFLTNEKTGLVCKQEDPQDLSEKIKRLFDDSDLRNKIIANASEMVREKYNWDNIAIKFREIYSNYANMRM